LTESQNIFRSVLNVVARDLRSAGFIRKGSTFTKAVGSNALIVNVQKSTSSSQAEIRFAVNLGVVVGELLDSDRAGPAEVKIEEAHVRTRLDAVMGLPRDQWWQIGPSTDSDALAKEVVSMVRDVALPYLGDLNTTRAVVNLWRSGVSPGLTARMRERYLRQLSQHHPVS
jgi:hypothetical protein